MDQGSHESRVKSSLEKLNVPAWYRDRQQQDTDHLVRTRYRHESGDSVGGRSASATRWRCGSAKPGYKRGEGECYSTQTSRDNSR